MVWKKSLLLSFKGVANLFNPGLKLLKTMDIQHLKNSDYLDILFEGRNKEYGGYELRRNYPRRVKHSLLVLAGISLAVAAYGLVNNEPVKLERKIAAVIMPAIIESPDVVPPKPVLLPPPAEPPLPAKPTLKLTPPVIEEDDKVKDTERPPENKELKDVSVGAKTQEGNKDGMDAPDLASTGGRGNSVVETKKKEPETFIYVEQMPQFNGNINQYLASNINYPASAREAGVDGRVVIKFVVSEDGSVTDAVVERSVNSALDAEALRVVRSMPKWKPGRQNGKAVKVYFRVPVKFTLE